MAVHDVEEKENKVDVTGARCSRVSRFKNLKHFKVSENKFVFHSYFECDEKLK